MYKIKSKPEDFMVREVMKLDFGRGRQTYFLLRKKNWNTLNAIEKIAQKLKISRRDFGYAGNKDKNAVTEQFVSVLDVGVERLEWLKIKDIKIEVLGNGKYPISLGSLEGNDFEIVVKEVKKERAKVDFFTNYFGEQRFGRENIKIGKLVVQRKFKEVCEALELETKQNDYVGALRSLGVRRLQFYLHSYQSYLWNLVVSEYLRGFENFEVDYKFGTFVFLNEKIKNFRVPLINFNTKFKKKEIKRIYSFVLNQEGIKKEDFLIKQIPEIVTTGVSRDLFVDVKWDGSAFFGKENSQTISFFLPKGCYATLLISKMFSECR